MENIRTYKQFKIVWRFVVIVYTLLYVLMIFAYIHQWGNKPIDKTGLVNLGIIFAIVLILIWLACGRFTMKFYDKFALVRSFSWIWLEIPFKNINNVSMERVKRNIPYKINFVGRNIEIYHVNFVKKAVSITMKNGEIYQIAIRNAEKSHGRNSEKNVKI